MDTGRRIALYGALGIAALGAAYGVGRLTLGPALAEARSGNTLINQEVPSHYLLAFREVRVGPDGQESADGSPYVTGGMFLSFDRGRFQEWLGAEQRAGLRRVRRSRPDGCAGALLRHVRQLLVHLCSRGCFLRRVTRQSGQTIVVDGGLGDSRTTIRLRQRDVLGGFGGVPLGERQEVLLEGMVLSGGAGLSGHGVELLIGWHPRSGAPFETRASRWRRRWCCTTGKSSVVGGQLT